MQRTPRRQRWLTLLVDALIGVFGLVAALVLWQWFQQGGGLEAVYVFIGVVLAGLWAGRRWLQGRLTQTEPSPVAPEGVGFLTGPSQQRNRENLLNNIQHVWIDGFLKHSLHSEVIRLTVGYNPAAVGHLPWDMVLKQVGQADQTITPERLLDIFDKSGRNLLILGEPGSGKTITLLQLAESLLDEARQDANAPVPLILNLSSWAREQRPLVEWLVEEALLQYGMSRDFTRAGIAGNNFYYLLDGLDEVAAEARDACAAAINEFKATHPAEMVVCCRVAEYEGLQQQLHLGSAIQIRPLNEAQINDYLSRPELELQTVKDTLAHDPDLRELAESPMNLSLMTLAYRGLRPGELHILDSKEARRHHLFDCYVEKMFERPRKSKSDSYTPQHAQCWLANLARGMGQYEQTTFYIEYLQPTWLSTKQLDRYRLICTLLYGLAFAGLVTPLTALLAEQMINATVGSDIGLVIGQIIGAFAGIATILSWVIYPRLRPESSLQIDLVEALAFRQPAWRALWFTSKDARGGFVLFFMGLGYILCTVTFAVPGAILLNVPYLEVLSTLSVMLISGFILLFFYVISYLLPEVIHIRGLQKILRPNDGIRRSAKNGCFMLLSVWLAIAVVLVPLAGWIYGLSVGVGGGLAVSLSYGGGTWAEHYLLRWQLARTGVLPSFSYRDRPFIQFLDAMHDRILLRRIGGGWVFIHRTLQDYFAALEDEGVRRP